MLSLQLTKDIGTTNSYFFAYKDFFDIYSKNLIGVFDENPELFY